MANGGGGGGHGDGTCGVGTGCGESGAGVLPGASAGTNNLAGSIFMGGAGAPGGAGSGNPGGGIVFIHAKHITSQAGAMISANGGATSGTLGSGGGAGGAVHLVSQTISGSLQLKTLGGSGEEGNSSTQFAMNLRILNSCVVIHSSSK